MTKEKILELSHKLIKDQMNLAYICGIQDMVDVLLEEIEEDTEENIKDDIEKI